MMLAVMEGATEPIAAPPSELPEFRGPPPPRHGGLLTLLRFLRRNGMLNHKYGRLIVRLWLWKLRLRRRLLLDGLAFVGPGCSLEVGEDATLELGRWSWVGHGVQDPLPRGHGLDRREDGAWPGVHDLRRSSTSRSGASA